MPGLVKGHLQKNLIAATQNLQRGYSEGGERLFTVLHSRKMTDNAVILKILLAGKEKAYLTHIKPRIDC